MPVMLDHQLLNALERRWPAQSPVLIPFLQPGLQDDAIDRLSKPLDFPLPEEVRMWYRWHNGSSGYDITIRRAMTGLADDVQQTLDSRTKTSIGTPPGSR